MRGPGAIAMLSSPPRATIGWKHLKVPRQRWFHIVDSETIERDTAGIPFPSDIWERFMQN